MVIYFDRLTNAHFSESFLVPVESEKKKKKSVDHPPPSQDVSESTTNNMDTGVNNTGSLIRVGLVEVNTKDNTKCNRLLQLYNMTAYRNVSHAPNSKTRHHY